MRTPEIFPPLKHADFVSLVERFPVLDGTFDAYGETSGATIHDLDPVGIIGILLEWERIRTPEIVAAVQGVLPPVVFEGITWSHETYTQTLERIKTRQVEPLYFINEHRPVEVGTNNPGTGDIITLCIAEEPEFATLICEALNAHARALPADAETVQDLMKDATSLLADLGAVCYPHRIAITTGGYDFNFHFHEQGDYWKFQGFHYTYGAEEDEADPTLGDYAFDLGHSPQALADWIRGQLRDEGALEDPDYDPDHA